LSAASIFVAADWGTRHLRLSLCRGGNVHQRCDGPGIAAVSAGAGPQTFQAVLSKAIAPWISAHGAMPVWIAGMAGSRNGWQETPYVPCPAGARALADSVLRFSAGNLQVAIAPGACCTNPLGAPDVMRGEETQVIGALAGNAPLAEGRHLLALPGTHTKWVVLEESRIATFHTTLSGELYSLLRDHSMLARAGNADAGNNGGSDGSSGGNGTATPLAPGLESASAGFTFGLTRSRALHRQPLAHLLFEARSRQLMDGMTATDALAFLSGLIIGQDVQGAQVLFERELSAKPQVTVIGARGLAELYRTAIAARGIETSVIDAADATVRGLHTLMSVPERAEAAHALAT
jgi:2-dehydro-3-deoxygalactonokinase